MTTNRSKLEPSLFLRDRSIQQMKSVDAFSLENTARSGVSQVRFRKMNNSVFGGSSKKESERSKFISQTN
jgi:hypothetical protein